MTDTNSSSYESSDTEQIRRPRQGPLTRDAELAKVDDSTPFATSKEEDSDDGVKTAHKKKEGKWEIPRDEDGNTDEERLVEKAIKGRGRKQVILEQRREEFLLKGMENPCEEFQDCTTNRKYKAEIKRLTEHLEEAPFRDVTATILEASTKVLGFSQKSKSLKGTHVKVLRDAAAAITAGANTSLTEVRKELEEVKQMLRGIREAPPHTAVVSSPPSKHPGNVGQGTEKAPQQRTGAPSSLMRMKKEERAITPPMVDMVEEEEEIPIGIIEIPKGLIPKDGKRPVKEARVARKEVGPKIRENVPLNTRVRVERREETMKEGKKGLGEEVSRIVFQAMNEWKSQETSKQGAWRKQGNKGKGEVKEMEEQGRTQYRENTYRKEFPQLPPTRQQKKEQAQQGKEETPIPQEVWTKVVGRREKKREKEEQRRKETVIKKVVIPEKKGGKKNKRRVPNTAAVTITAEKGQYKDLLAEAKRRIDLEGIGIEKIKTRVGATGALVFEIPGEERNKQADLLADKLKEVLTDRARVSRPQKMGELRLKGLEISTSEKEVVEAVAKNNMGTVPPSGGQESGRNRKYQNWVDPNQSRTTTGKSTTMLQMPRERACTSKLQK
ncbi:ABC transporter F family member 4-like [Harpegnathos saltator]|uniref:ABC transporter F family member 4-like n=1 Tax=Harpegnathos saltator TaxID=610380 RepID=UPI000DBEE177|nr:ABC transporter F family member 4-like [Harpegnathos saltator]